MKILVVDVMSYEVEPGGYLLEEENFGEHSIELINGEKNGSVWLIVDNEKFLVNNKSFANNNFV